MDTTLSISHRVGVTLLLLFLSATDAVLPNGKCSVEGMTCEFQDENLIGIIDGVTSAEECKLECENNSTECLVYSYYGSAGAPFSDTCLLFRECQVLDPVEECFTEDVACVIFCNAPVEGQLGSENLIDIVADISKDDCEGLCDVEEQCQFFTYHFSNATLYPSTCFLLSKIQEPITACQEAESCTSGSPNCENSLCGLLENGILFPNGSVITASKEIDLLTIGPCSESGVLAVVVGGGGSKGGYASGQGSGYVEFQRLQLSQPYLQIEATVGSDREQSMLSTISDVLLTALPGKGGEISDGGDGYSGGGASYAGVGGSDGGDGQESSGGSGGKGSGLDLQTIPLKNFELR